MTFSYLYDLEPLNDIIDTLETEFEFNDEPSIFSEEYALELVETALHLMEELMEQDPTLVSEPDFHTILMEELRELFYIQLEEEILKSDYIEDDMNDILEYAFEIYTTTFHTERSSSSTVNNYIINDNTTTVNEININKTNDTTNDNTKNVNTINNTNTYLELENKINYLKSIPQPVQRTKEWYEFRWKMITASNAWKAFESQKTMNQLIYEKCQPIYSNEDEPETKTITMVNTNTALHWGQKYEPLSVMLYEKLYDSKVADFGCIQHPNYPFIGASPDGIVVQSNTGRYGRMLEIKNIVNREINGIPKKEYWIQMQLQMEVCDLDECDFLETKFMEYPDYTSYCEDILQDGKHKGIIIYFHTKEGKPHYEYMPLHLKNTEEMDEWKDEMIAKYHGEPYNYSFLKYIYWKLEILSCVLVLRNRDWFKNNIAQLENVWKIIEQERVSGYEHRAPNRKPKKEPPVSQVEAREEHCFLKVVKL
jgi:putative phage-type endonuclease